MCCNRAIPECTATRTHSEKESKMFLPVNTHLDEQFCFRRWKHNIQALGWSYDSFKGPEMMVHSGFGVSLIGQENKIYTHTSLHWCLRFTLQNSKHSVQCSLTDSLEPSVIHTHTEDCWDINTHPPAHRFTHFKLTTCSIISHTLTSKPQ